MPLLAFCEPAARLAPARETALCYQKEGEISPVLKHGPRSLANVRVFG